MLSITAAVLITFTVTATPTPTIVATPTVVQTMTVGEKNLFDQLVQCGIDSDKASHDAYNNGWKEGVHDQWCVVQCRFLKTEKRNYKEYLADAANPDKKSMADLYTEWAERTRKEVEESKSRIRKEKCICSNYKD